MARPRTISDDDILIEARRLFVEGGSKGLSFGALSRATGLAPATLAQRFGTIAGLQQAAALTGWLRLTAATDAACQNNPSKGPQGLLRLLDPIALEALHLLTLSVECPEAVALAAQWRARVEGGLALRLGQGERARLAAQALFLAWQGQLMWQAISSGAGELRLKDLAKRLS